MSKRIDLEQLYRTDPWRACRLALRRAKGADPAIQHRGWSVIGAVSAQLGMFGTAVIRGEWQGGYWGDIVAEYANSGDAYACTVLYDVRRGCYLVTSYGDWVEREERQGRIVQ